ncbi:UNVERIFIED_ORG: hypothetical protein J2W87_001546 [Pseudomonas putida]|nr:hypothetical protein [Pseudomonas putida]
MVDENAEEVIHEQVANEPFVTLPPFVPLPEPPPCPEPSPPYVYQVRNMTQFKDGVVDCEVLHESFGWIPFTAVPGDTAPATLAVFEHIGAYGVDVATLPESPNLATSITSTERSWRDHELTVADVELLKAEDGDPASKGTPTEWRQYRVDLRNWPESPDFPDSGVRPVRPGSSIASS